MEWHLIAASAAAIAWRENGMALVEVSGRRICVARAGEMLSAFAPGCPHAGAPLCEGWLDAKGNVVCPLHKYRFSPQNGRNVSGEGYHLRVFPMRVEDRGGYIGLPEGGG